MESSGTIKSILKPANVAKSDESLASRVKNIEGKLREARRVVNFTQPLSDKGEEKKDDKFSSHVSDKMSPVETLDSWEDPGVNAMLNTDTDEFTDELQQINKSFANVVQSLTQTQLDGDLAAKSSQNSNVAFTLVKNYVTNTWSKYGFQKVIKDEDNFFFFKFESITGVSQVLEQVKSRNLMGQVYIKSPIVAIRKNVLVLMLTIAKPVMLDTFTCAMCNDPWGRIGFARALIEVNATKDLKKEVIMAVPNEDGTEHTNVNIQAEYEWKPPLCLECHVFGHTLAQCPNNVKEPATVNEEAQIDGFTTVSNRKHKGKKQSNTNLHGCIKLQRPKTFEYRLVATPTAEKHIKQIVSASTKEKHVKQVESSPVVTTNHFEALNYDAVRLVDEGETSGKNKEDGLASANEDTQADRTASKGCRIILGWNKDVVNIMALSQSSQVMHVKIFHKASNNIIFCSFIYAGNLPAERRVLWADLGLHKQVVRGSPWILMGDFNVALNLEDSISGSSRLNAAMLDFKTCVNRIEVMDINSSGLHYTWNQKPRGGGGILKKLDRIMGNLEFVDTFPAKTEVVGAEWSKVVDGHHMFQVVTKMKALKKPLRKLLHSHGNLHERVNSIRLELDEAKLVEEWFLKQKAKIEWLDVGDSNSAFFHKSVKSRNRSSRIEVIRGEGDVDVLGSLVADTFVSHYKDFLGTSMACDVLNTDGLFIKHISAGSRDQMVQIVTNEETKAAMFSIGENRAPGPDGFSLAFFKKSWDIVGNDICRAIWDFFVNGKLLKEINHTFLALIPKVSTPLRVTDYRPISCCNILYKCISKILTNRIIDRIKEVISDNQSAFIPGRRISNNILIMKELMHNYHIDRGPPRCAFKVDIQKAYDTVNWVFLRNILKCFGFHMTMVKWIMACVSSASFWLSINGDIHGFFQARRGLRQGDPLSPHLFTLVMEIVNMCFADDLFIFTKGEVDSARLIMDSLDEFQKSSGLF
ncbi:hypothetical protein Tco_0824304 [Tanacetum coccineum]|uniref:Reverse transcriptase domain-containing protein n=1 Tax=Tanacetum coccineum TaxID=301880 RepID=A0ABQ5AKG4_9ASTR